MFSWLNISPLVNLLFNSILLAIEFFILLVIVLFAIQFVSSMIHEIMHGPRYDDDDK